jgi:hypothetical protein
MISWIDDLRMDSTTSTFSSREFRRVSINTLVLKGGDEKIRTFDQAPSPSYL